MKKKIISIITTIATIAGLMTAFALPTYAADETNGTSTTSAVFSRQNEFPVVGNYEIRTGGIDSLIDATVELINGDVYITIPKGKGVTAYGPTSMFAFPSTNLNMKIEVHDKDSGEAIPGVNVYFTDATELTIKRTTDERGTFNISKLDADVKELVIEREIARLNAIVADNNGIATDWVWLAAEDLGITDKIIADNPAPGVTPEPTVAPTPVPTEAPTPALPSTEKPEQRYSDVPTTHWAYSNIERISELGAFSGYNDGTFLPNNQITHEEFTKVVVSLIYNGDVANAQKTAVGSNWADWTKPYLNAAVEIGIITADDIDLAAVGTPITRAEMAKIISRAMGYLGEEPVADTSAYEAAIADWNSIDDEYKPYVAQAYAKGIINGYNDGTFGATNSLTRAEASAVIIRLINADER